MVPISVCIIAKNEEKKIERLLKSIAPYQFEIVLVDTGSTDRTKEIALKYTDKIFDFKWENDFSSARNYSLSKASNNWIFMLDCDEWIESIDLEELHYFRKHLSDAVGSVSRVNLTGSLEHPGKTVDQTERFFDKKKYYYTGIIHEQLTPKFKKQFETFLLNATIGHDGYFMTEQERILKSKRNIELLQKQLSLNPDNTYVLYQIGKGYEMVNDFTNACQYFKKAFHFELDSSLAYVQSLTFAYTNSLLKTNQFKEAMKLIPFIKTFEASADASYFIGTIYNANKFYDQALDYFEAALTFPNARTFGANSFLSHYKIGYILSLIQEWETAKQYFLLCGDYPPAKTALKVLAEQDL